jgi:hypothetical protein
VEPAERQRHDGESLLGDDSVEIVGLAVTAVTKELDRVSKHGVRRTIPAAQADVLGLPLFEAAQT